MIVIADITKSEICHISDMGITAAISEIRQKIKVKNVFAKFLFEI